MTLPASIRIAITTNDLVQVDASFASAQQVVIYEVTSRESEFIDCHQFRAGGGGKGQKDGQCWMLDADADSATLDRNQAKMQAMDGCAMVFSLGLSDIHALAMRGRGMFPVKMERPREIPAVVEQVQRMLRSPNPPLWMRRALAGRSAADEFEAQVA